MGLPTVATPERTWRPSGETSMEETTPASPESSSIWVPLFTSHKRRMVFESCLFASQSVPDQLSYPTRLSYAQNALPDRFCIVSSISDKVNGFEITSSTAVLFLE